jgi:hypothetical protein
MANEPLQSDTVNKGNHRADIMNDCNELTTKAEGRQYMINQIKEIIASRPDATRFSQLQERRNRILQNPDLIFQWQFVDSIAISFGQRPGVKKLSVVQVSCGILYVVTRY